MALIHEKIFNIQKDMPTLQKNGVGPQTQGSYKFLAVDDVLSAIRPLLVEHGVIVVPVLVDKGFHYNAAADKGDGRVPRESIQAWVEYEFRFVAHEDGSEIVTRVVGEGIDTQDKAIRKATTSAWKIALIQTFALITGEPDPDSQDGAHAAQSDVAKPTSAARAVQKAQNATVAQGVDQAVEKVKREIREKFVTTGIVTPADLNKLRAKIEADPKHKGATQIDVYTELAKRLEAGEVA